MAERKLTHITATMYGPKVDLGLKLSGLPLSDDIQEFLNEAKKRPEAVMISFEPFEIPTGKTADFGYLFQKGIDYALITFCFDSSEIRGKYQMLHYQHNDSDSRLQKMKFEIMVPR